MTRSSGRTRKPQPRRSWPLQDAKARFSELVRLARTDGPQAVTVHGKDGVVVVAAEDYHRLASTRTGADLIAVLRESPYPEVDLAPPRGPMLVRDADL
jgi:prevent-host-death family protein